MNDITIMIIIIIALGLLYTIEIRNKSNSKSKDENEISDSGIEVIEIIKNCTVYVFRCKKCGAKSVRLERNEVESHE